MDSICKSCEHLRTCGTKIIGSGKTIMTGCSRYRERKLITNADRIRAMTDEDLAELWWERLDCGECPVHRDCKMTGQDCKKLALDWLRQEAKD